ncbi:hypothetical protein [Sagittula stellata]|uniref:Uncharacterized protein n=1 Tax=Sagittula stellata (strain ATCC 700073 / DSM 11524 / E-37) TaxID=388399 RepID=A3K4K5_SAGS3|nr:hypothetical protein [Sagittula stellata]EBA07904.1 hypothetical protein SSE37_01585 [Sagittula stellata E-37]
MAENEPDTGFEGETVLGLCRQIWRKRPTWILGLLRDAGLLVSIGGLLLTLFTFYLDHRAQVRYEMSGTLVLLKKARDSVYKIEVSQSASQTPLRERPSSDQRRQYEIYEELRYMVPNQLVDFDPCLDQVERDLKDFAVGAKPPRRILDEGVPLMLTPFAAIIQDLAALEAQIKHHVDQRIGFRAWLVKKSFAMEVSHCFALLPD